jgi:hypothetical protein
MASKSEQQKSSASGLPPGSKRYRSMAEIKRDLFPKAAAEETALVSGNHNYEHVMDEFFPRHDSGKA